MNRSTALFVLCALALAACGGKESPRAIASATRDSIAAAERAETAGPGGAIGASAEAGPEGERRSAAAIRQAREILTRRIHFALDVATLSPEAERILLEKVAVLRAYPEVTLRIEGHADERGSVEYNLALAQRRADAAKRFLVGYGIDPDRLVTVSFGEARPLVEAHTLAAYAKNRRAEFVITSAGERLAGGRDSRQR